MKCPKCGSENVNVQMVTESQLKNKHHSVIWWICIGWWWVPLSWLCFFFIKLILKIFGHKKQKAIKITKPLCRNNLNSQKRRMISIL